MKVILYFIGLKILEVGGLIGFIFLTVTIGKIAALIIKGDFLPESWKPWKEMGFFWGGAVVWLLLFCVGIALVMLGYQNWEWAIQLAQ